MSDQKVLDEVPNLKTVVCQCEGFSVLVVLNVIILIIFLITTLIVLVCSDRWHSLLKFASGNNQFGCCCRQRHSIISVPVQEKGTSSNNSKYDSYTTSHPEFCSSLYSNETRTKESNVSSTATCFNSGVERQSLMNNDNVSSEANRQSSFNDGLDSRSFKVERQSLLNNGSDFRSSEVERLSSLNIGSDQNSLERQPLLNNDSLQSSFEKFSSENNSSWQFDNSHSAPQFSLGNSRKHVCENQRLGSLAEDSIDFSSRNCNKIKKDITALEQTERKHFIQDDLSKEQPCLVPHSQSLNSETNDIKTLGKGTLQEATDHYNENETSSENESIHCDGNRTMSENESIHPMGVMSDIENIQHNIMESMSENECELKQFSENILPVPDEQIKILVCNIISVDGMKSSSITSMKINSCSTGSLVHPVQEVGSRIQSRRSSFCDLKRNFSDSNNSSMNFETSILSSMSMDSLLILSSSDSNSEQYTIIRILQSLSWVQQFWWGANGANIAVSNMTAEEGRRRIEEILRENDINVDNFIFNIVPPILGRFSPS